MAVSPSNMRASVHAAALLLSIGALQRDASSAMARALLVLDDASSNMSRWWMGVVECTENAVHELIVGLIGGLVSLCVSHRLQYGESKRFM